MKKAPKEGLFSNLFRSVLSSKKAPRYKVMDEICLNCQNRENERRATRPQQPAPYDFAEIRAQQTLRAKNAIQAGKDQFLCTKCTREGRSLVYGVQRTANNGLCCDNGRKEWEVHEKLARLGRSPPRKTDGHSLPARANSRPAQSPTTAAARQAASQASQDYGWSRDQALRGQPHTTQETREVRAVGFNPRGVRIRVKNCGSGHLEPGLARDFAALPGYVIPTQTTEQGTYHVEAGIDFYRWGSHPQTHHGRYPAPAPAPKSALPLPPRQSDKRGRDLIHQKPVPQTPPSGTQRVSPPRAPNRERNHSLRFKASQSYQQKTSSREPHRSRPLPHRQATPPPLRSTRGKAWHDSADLASRSPLPPVTPQTNSHRLSRPFPQPHPSHQSQHITSISPLTSPPPPFSPVSPINASRFPDFDDEVAPLSFGKKTSSFREEVQRPNPPPSAQYMGSEDELDRAFRKAFGAAECWERDLKSMPSQRRRR